MKMVNLVGDSSRRILVIGAAGSMTTTFLRAISGAKAEALCFDLRDIDLEGAERSRAMLGHDRATAGKLDLFDAGALAAALDGAAFVINGVGPFHRTADPVRKAAITARVPYLDIDDDVESTLEARALSDDAVAAGIPIFVGCGASPGLTNVLALDLVSRLDQVDTIDVAWCVGDEGPVMLGRSVLGHTLHMGAGGYRGWRGGGLAERRSYANSRRWPLPGLGRQSFYECAHPEPVMLGSSFAGVTDVTCWGTVHPGPLNGMIKGVAEAEAAGWISYDAAIDFLRDAIAARPTDKHVEKLAMAGVRQQLERGEISRWEYCSFLVHAVLKRQYPTVAGTAALVRGSRAGRPLELMRYIDSSPAASPLKVMDQSTGCAEATFFLEALTDRARALSGTFFPEQWTDPAAFYRRFAATVPPGAGDWLGPVLERAAGSRGAWQAQLGRT